MKKLGDFTKNAQDAVVEIEKEVTARTGTAIAAGFAFVMALTWNEFIKDAVTKILEVFKFDKNMIFVRLLVALLTTLICVVGIYYFSKLGKKSIYQPTLDKFISTLPEKKKAV